VTAAVLRDLAPHLGDIHGQHDQQLLFSVESQRDMLDESAGLNTEPVRDLYREWNRLAAELQELDRNEQDRLRLADLWSFQRREIETANPKPGEDVELENERRVLKNVAKLQELASAAYDALYDAPESASAQLTASLRRVEELARIDERLADVVDALKPAVAGVEDASFTLRDYLGGLEADPARLDEIEGRLATIEKLKRKYGSTLDEVLAFLETVRQQLGASEDAGERRARLQRERDAVAERYRAAAGQLSTERRKAAAQLKKRVEAELKSLAMERTVFEARMEPAAWAASGADAVRFLISPNPGEEPRPLEKTASGGELSRVALALKTCVAGENGRPSVPRTLVFDEVDAGVGGGAAEAVGRRLKRLAASSQVLCVTHLPQIAGFADHHYSVSKRESNGRTVAAIEELDAAGRRQEIGRMLSGERVTPEALRHAEQLMRAGG
jgi:DNA repair protein RecN (Recombination protein N)